MSNFKQFGINQGDEGMGERTKRFKGEGGKRYRLSFVWWPGLENDDLDLKAETPVFTGAQRHYIAGAGYVINQGPEYTKVAGSPPRMSIGTIVLVWPTDNKGRLDKARVGNGDFEIKPWIFGQDKYKDLTPIHQEFHFGQHDVNINCTDTQYQKMSFSPCKDSILERLKGSKHWDAIVSRVKTLAASIQGEIGQELTLEQLREKMNGGSDSGGGGGTSSSVASEDIDSLVDNLLDD